LAQRWEPWRRTTSAKGSKASGGPFASSAKVKAQTGRKGGIFPHQGDTVGERFETACEAARLSGVVFHLLRHESLSRYAERGMDPLRLQLIGGHRDLRHVARCAKLTAKGLANEV
jgi:integrase